jgi:hypothetical protein
VTAFVVNVSIWLQFMKRKQEAELRESLEEKQQRIVDESHWVIAVAEKAHHECVHGAGPPCSAKCSGQIVFGICPSIGRDCRYLSHYLEYRKWHVRFARVGFRLVQWRELYEYLALGSYLYYSLYLSQMAWVLFFC